MHHDVQTHTHAVDVLNTTFACTRPAPVHLTLTTVHGVLAAHPALHYTFTNHFLSLENHITVAQSEVEGVRYIPIHRPFLQRVPGRFFEEISDPTDRASKYNMPI